VSIWFAVVAKDNVIYGIIGAQMEVDLQQMIFLTLLILGCILFFMTLCGVCTAVKRFCFCHWIFAILVTLAVVIFLALGIAIIVIAKMAAQELDDLCASGDTSSDLAKSLNELYTKSDTFYCVAPATGCTCFVTHTPGDGGSYSTTETASTVRNVQGCSDKILAAFASFNVDFSDLTEAIEYFDYFGEIEEKYSCSGICTVKPKYYFYDSSKGQPSKRCKDSIKDEYLLGEVLGYGIGYTISGGILFLIWFIQYGLCCRRKNRPGQGTKRV
jgi:hypothetical protein